MFLISIILIGIVGTHSTIGNSLFIVERDDCSDRLFECLMSSKAITPVCGTDRITYSSFCQVISKQCRGESIGVDHIGPCSDKSPCFSLRQRVSSSVKPRCKADGSFALVQCHRPSGYCWCVTPSGNRLPKTLIQYHKPRCIRALSAAPLSSNTAVSIFKRQPLTAPIWKRRWQCNANQMWQFTENIIKTFEIEYNRANTSGNSNTNEIILWKFHSLDANKNCYLDLMEYQVLLRLAEKTVTPNKCVHLFSKICDKDRDSRLSMEEWITCLSNSNSSMADRPSSSTGVPLNDETVASDNEEESGADDCPSRRLRAMNYQKKTTQQNFFIPECTDDGKYRSVQCYTGLCWCVNGDTGSSIPRSSVRGEKPNCSGVNKIMRGCPSVKYQSLLKDMMEIMMGKLNSSVINETLKSSGSAEESAVTWMFFLLDSNKNKVLQRGMEWRNIRMMVPGNRCSKKLPKFCDLNGDSKINISEWLDCFNVTRRARLRGINPITILQSV